MLTLILGGARSGKSRHARRLCERASEVVYIATARADDSDPEMRARIERHRRDRPAAWTTVEEPRAPARFVREALSRGASVILDCVTLWISNLHWELRALPDEEREAKVLERAAELARSARGGNVVLVSNEVGAGLVPEHPVGRSFRDLQGTVNQILAAEADRVILVVAGCPLVVKDGETD